MVWRPSPQWDVELDDILDAWRVNNSVNLRFLALCPDEAFELKPGKGKTVRSNWVHIVWFRRSYLEERMRKAAVAVPKLDWKTATREEIAGALKLSYELTRELLGLYAAKPNRLTAAKFFAVSIAHEANHRAQIEVSLRMGGIEFPEGETYKLWDWANL